jgi:hypothetical protein
LIGNNIQKFITNKSPVEQADERLLRKLPPNTESAVILVARVPELRVPLTAFIRLKHATILYPEVPDHPLPVRFLWILMNPVDNYRNETLRIGRTLGALFSDEVIFSFIYLFYFIY